MKKVCVIGYPAKHSLSPVIHNYWLKKYGIEGSYEIREVEPEKFKDFFLNLNNEGYVGCNVTLPFKEKSFELVKNIDGYLGSVEHAMKAINTVLIKNGKYEGKNTDGVGFFYNLKDNLNINLKAGKIVVLGAGGAARAIIVGLIVGNVKELFLLNRTIEKAEKIQKEIGKIFPEVNINVINWDDRSNVLKNIYLLINTTSLGMVGQPPLDINLDYLPKEALVTDIVYRPLITPILEKAQKRGNPIVDGLGMLLHQAKPGFEMWFEEELKAKGISGVEVTPELREIVIKSGNLS